MDFTKRLPVQSTARRPPPLVFAKIRSNSQAANERNKASTEGFLTRGSGTCRQGRPTEPKIADNFQGPLRAAPLRPEATCGAPGRNALKTELYP